MEAQHERYYSTTSLYLVTEAMKEITNLSEKWEWESEDLFFAGIGSPAAHIGNMSEKGIFQPAVSLRAKKRRARMISSMRQYRREMQNLPPEESDTVDYNSIEVGSIPIRNYEYYKEVRTMRHLESVCDELWTNFEERLRPSPLLKAAVDAFHENIDWFVESPDDSESDEEGQSNANLDHLILQMKSTDITSTAPFSCIFDTCTWKFISLANTKEHVIGTHPNWEKERSRGGGGRRARIISSAPHSSTPSSSSLQSRTILAGQREREAQNQKASANLDNLIQQKKSTDITSTAPFSCIIDTCSWKFISIANVKEHVMGTHPNWEKERSRGGGGRRARFSSAPHSSTPSSSSFQSGPIPTEQREREVENQTGDDISQTLLSPSHSLPSPSHSLPSPSHSLPSPSQPLPPPGEPSNYVKAQEIIRKVFDELSPAVATGYSLDALTEGFIMFLRFRKGRDWESLEELFGQFHKMYIQSEEAGEFISFFQKIQIKSFSEAIAESIGSIMKISKGKNRNLEPINFSKEIYLCFNLPPLHILKISFIPELVRELRKVKKFFRETAKGPASYIRKLKHHDSSASLGNYRSREESRARLPLEFFKPATDTG